MSIIALFINNNNLFIVIPAAFITGVFICFEILTIVIWDNE